MRPVKGRPTAHGKVDGVGIIGMLTLCTLALRPDQLYMEGLGDASGYFVLHVEEIRTILGEPIGPDMPARFRIDELRIDPDLVAIPPHAPLQGIPHAELVAYLFRVRCFALEGESGVGRNDEAV